MRLWYFFSPKNFFRGKWKGSICHDERVAYRPFLQYYTSFQSTSPFPISSSSMARAITLRLSALKGSAYCSPLYRCWYTLHAAESSRNAAMESRIHRWGWQPVVLFAHTPPRLISSLMTGRFTHSVSICIIFKTPRRVPSCPWSRLRAYRQGLIYQSGVGGSGNYTFFPCWQVARWYLSCQHIDILVLWFPQKILYYKGNDLWNVTEY